VKGPGVQRDVHETGEATGPRRMAPGSALLSRLLTRVRRIRLNLSAKLLLLTVVFVMLAEVLIFVPSVANYRVTWLVDRLTAARLASLAAEAVPGGVVPAPLKTELLRTAQVKAVALKRADQRLQVLPAEGDLSIDSHYDLTMAGPRGIAGGLGVRVELIRDALAVFFARDGRIIRVVGRPASSGEDIVDIVLPETPLKSAMVRYGLNIMGLSVIISVIAASLVYFALNGLLVQPMMRITRNMVGFSRNPEDTSRIIVPSARTDEIGTAERELAHMQGELSHLLLQKNRLAQLGLAVSKINHDLRNMLANAQLISDRLATVPDPTVQRFAPKLIASLDRAISFCNDTLRFGRAEEAAPRRELLVLKPLVADIGDGLGLPRETVGWQITIPDGLKIDADREHLVRVLSNLVRNAVQAIEQAGPAMTGANPGSGPPAIAVTAVREGRRVAIEVRDSGPGIPPRARAHLFQAFQGSSRKGGTGLGLVIAAELIAAHGGALTLLDVPVGAAFRIEIPDRAN